jgi:hypothetical protein
MQEVVIEPIYQKAIFWISVAFIINFSGNFFLFLYSLNISNDEIFRTQYIIIYTIVTVIKNIFLCIAISINEPLQYDSDKITFDVDLDAIIPTKNQN